MGLLWIAAEEAARNKGSVLPLFREILRSLNSPKLQLNYAASLAKKAEARAVFMLGSKERSKNNIADLVDAAEYTISELKDGQIPKNITQY